MLSKRYVSDVSWYATAAWVWRCKRDTVRAIVAQACDCPPEEGCGLLVGESRRAQVVRSVPCRPAQAPDPSRHYVIVSLKREAPESRGFHVVDGRVTEEVLPVV